MSTSTIPPSLEEVKDILHPDKKEDEIVNVLETDEERAVAARIIPKLTEKISKEASVMYAKLLDKEVTALKAANEKIIQDTVERIKKDSQPLDAGEIEKLLSQEYLTISFKVPRRVGGEMQEQEFILCEVPMSVERKFLKVLNDKLMPNLKQITSIDFQAAATTADKYQAFIEMIPGALEVMAELASIALNPRKEFDYVTVEWVMDHLSANRIFNVLQAQITVSRMRDFFLAAFRSSRL